MFVHEYLLEIKRLRRALGFYANPRQWQPVSYERGLQRPDKFTVLKSFDVVTRERIDKPHTRAAEALKGTPKYIQSLIKDVS